MKKKNLLFFACCVLLFATLACTISQAPIQPQSPTQPQLPEQSPTKTQNKPANSPTARPVSTATQPPILTATLTATQQVDSASSFDLQAANQVLPDDILDEVSYYAGGGGPDYSSCTEPKIGLAPRDQELLTLNGFVVCGLSESQVLTGKIQYPDGRVLTQKVQTEPAGNTYFGRFAFKPKIDDPIGIYTFSLEGKEGKLEAQARYRLPDGPRLFKMDNYHILLYGFAPYETVKLFYYTAGEDIWRFGGWKEYKTNDSGQSIISVSIGQGEGGFDNSQLGVYFWSDTFIAVGEKTGEVNLLHNGPLGGGFSLVVGEIKKQIAYCEGLASRIGVTQRARAAFTDGTNMRIREKPGFSQKILGAVPEGTPVTILQGPQCAGGSTWWYVRTDNGIEGWMTEYQGEIYLLEPIQQ